MKPSVALLCCLISVALATLVRKPVTDRLLLSSELTQAYLEAMARVRVNLAGHLHALNDEESLDRNLNWGLSNSTQKYLTGLLRPGELDAVRVLTPPCIVMSEARLSGIPAPRCPDTGLEYGFSWSSAGDVPLLSLAMPAGDGKYILYGEVRLGERWRESHPRLSRLLQQLDAAIMPAGRDDGKVLATDGDTADGPAAALVSGDLWLRYLPLPPAAVARWLDDFIILWVGGSALLFFMTLFGHRQSLRRETKNRTAFFKWCHELAEKTHLALPHAKAATWDEAKNLLQAITDKLSQEGREKREECAQLKLRLQAVESDFVALERQEAEYAQRDSLSEQMTLTSPAFAAELQKTGSLLEDLRDTALTGLKKEAQDLCHRMQSWQQSLQEMTSRKFLRTLSEKIHEDGSTELDRELQRVFANTQHIANGAINLSLLAGKANQRFARLKHFGAHWQSLATAEPAFKLQKLQEPLDESMRMTRLATHFPKINWDAGQHDKVPMPPVSICDQTWISVFMHLELALLYSLPAEHAGVLTIRSREREDQWFVVFAVSLEMAASGGLSPRGREHFQLARRLVSGRGVHITELPHKSGVPPLALSWPATGARARLTSEHAAFGSMDQT